MERKKLLTYLIISVVIISLIVFFYPKASVVGGLRGLVSMDATAYREEFNCIGIKYDYCPQQIADYGCDYLCFGMPSDRKCYIEGYDEKNETGCR